MDVALISARIRYAVVALIVVLSACATEAMEPTPTSQVPETGLTGLTITIGDISDEPTKKIDRFQPLADYLASNLSEFGFSTGRVVIASSVEDMIKLVQDGQVDVYFDSPFPALTTQANTGTELILRRWKDGDEAYVGVIVAARDSGIETMADLRGRTIAAEEPYSTSGFASQAIALMDAGLELKVVANPDSHVSSNVVGVWFSRDEENTIEAIVTGTVPAGLLSDRDFVQLPDELRRRIRVLAESEPLPRQVVSVRGDLNEQVVSRIRDLLLRLEETIQGRVLLDHVKTLRFDDIPPDDRARLGAFAVQLRRLP